MKKVAFYLVFIVFLTGCFEDTYRYFCQNPANFSAKRCQRPDCLFTQDCPDYLVAPVLEKQIAAQQPAPTASSDR